MKQKIALLLSVVAVVSVFLLLPTPAHNPKAEGQSFILGPVQIFDGEKVADASFIEVQDGMIVALHNAQPESDLAFIQGNHQWVMPGLIDAHVHAWGGALEDNLARGVTTVIDMFGDPRFLAQHKPKRSNREFSNQADLFGAGLLMTAPQGHGTQYGIQVSTLSHADQAMSLISERIHTGSDFIKIVYTHKDASYAHAPSISKTELEASIQAAHAQNLMAVVHISDARSAMDAVQAGADGLVHSFFDEVISDELLALMKDSGVFIIPTMVVYEGMLRGSINERALFSNNDLNIERSARATLSRTFNNTEFPVHFYTNLLETTQKLHSAGIPVLAGSDAPNPNTAHGWSLIIELMLLEEAGLPAHAVLSAATQQPALAFNLPERGMIAPGMRADILLLQNSPFEQLDTLLAPKGIWKNGYRVK
ncbi:amidohydrolase family protein [Aliidiomarina celeris]|uniref:amidohydrolase family protein n=1 Tax=Aliidiomarina celeris TaxID=2249428 RepID=UPI000DE9CF27|nr:amidohydrolase family protein [Aliidiomarina celeris]